MEPGFSEAFSYIYVIFYRNIMKLHLNMQRQLLKKFIYLYVDDCTALDFWNRFPVEAPPFTSVYTYNIS